MAAPRVLIADKLSPAAAQIFKDRGVETDTKTGLDKEQFLFYTHATNRHCDCMPLNGPLSPRARAADMPAGRVDLRDLIRSGLNPT